MLHEHVHILLIEDDDCDAATLERAFHKAEVTNSFTRVYDGIEGIEFLKFWSNKDVPILILLDLNMPRMGGIEFLQTIRKDPDLSHSVVFVMTTSKDEKDIWKAYEHRISGYLVKEAENGLDIAALVKDYCRVVKFPQNKNKSY